ncbi:MAG: hypothetical protein LUE26_09205 [Alistipes sp.]|nr:hypothetical protein [Alistipes sp.]
MKKYILTFILLTAAGQSFGQDGGYFIVKRALDAGIFDFDRIRREPLRVFYDEEADREFEKRLKADSELSAIFEEYYQNEPDGEIHILRELEAYEYYPDHGIAMLIGGHGYVSAFDVNRRIYVWGSPQFTWYSPSQRYRLTGLRFDGAIDYCLEERVDGEYVCLGRVDFGNHVSPRQCYWVDDETIYYLQERKRNDGTPYWLGYEGRFERVR